MKLKGAVDIGWDKVSELRISNDGTMLTAGSYLSNFVSLWSIDATNLISTDSQKRSSPSRIAESKRSVPVPSFSSPSGDLHLPYPSGSIPLCFPLMKYMIIRIPSVFNTVVFH